jgi:hypothetical protein
MTTPTVAEQRRESVIRVGYNYKPSRLLELLTGVDRTYVTGTNATDSGQPSRSSPTAALDSLKISGESPAGHDGHEGESSTLQLMDVDPFGCDLYDQPASDQPLFTFR